MLKSNVDLKYVRKEIHNYILNKIHSALFADIIWTILGQIIFMLCLLIVNKIVSLNYSVAQFGQYNLIRNSSSVLSFIMLGGLGITVPRYIAIYKKQNKISDEICFLIASLCYMGMCILGVCFFCFFFNTKLTGFLVGTQSYSMLFALLLYSMTIAIYTYAFSIYRGIGNFKIYNGIQIAYSILTIIPLFFISYLSLFQLFLLWSCICLTFNGFVFYKGMKQKIKTFLRLTKYPIVKVKIREVFKYSSPRLLGDFFLFSLTSFPILYIGYKSDLTTVSYFSVGMFFVKMIQPLFSFLGIILLPYVSNCFAVKQVDKAASLIHKILVIEIIVALVIVLLLYWFMPFWIRIFFSATYGESEECAKVLLLSIFPTVLYLLYRNPIDAVSVFPYNTLLLFVVFCLLLLSFYYSETMMQYAWSYVVISWTKGIGSYVCWNTLKNKKYGV